MRGSDDGWCGLSHMCWLLIACCIVSMFAMASPFWTVKGLLGWSTPPGYVPGIGWTPTTPSPPVEDQEDDYFTYDDTSDFGVNATDINLSLAIPEDLEVNGTQPEGNATSAHNVTSFHNVTFTVLPSTAGLRSGRHLNHRQWRWNFRS